MFKEMKFPARWRLDGAEKEQLYSESHVAVVIQTHRHEDERILCYTNPDFTVKSGKLPAEEETH